MNAEHETKSVNGSEPSQIANELFTFTGLKADGTQNPAKPLREASDAELAIANAQFKEHLIQARVKLTAAVGEAANIGQLVAVIEFEIERRAKSIVIAKHIA